MLQDQATRGQVIKMTEEQARQQKVVSAWFFFLMALDQNPRAGCAKRAGCVCLLLPWRPTFLKHTARSQSQNRTGISSGVKWFLVVRCSLVQYAPASFYWSRVASATGRLSQYLTGSSAYTWRMLVADDFHLEAGGANYRAAQFHFFTLCTVANVSWSKTAGERCGSVGGI